MFDSKRQPATADSTPSINNTAPQASQSSVEANLSNAPKHLPETSVVSSRTHVRGLDGAKWMAVLAPMLLLFPTLLFISQHWPDPTRRVGFVLAPIAALYFFMLQPRGVPAQRRNLIPCTAIACLLAILAWQPEWQVLCLLMGWGFACFALGLARHGQAPWYRWASVSLLVMLPFIFETTLWDQVTWFVHRSSGWETGAILDGLEIPNQRLGSILLISQGELNMGKVRETLWSLEFTLTFALLYVQFFRRSLWIASGTCFLAFFMWISWQSLRWVFAAYQQEGGESAIGSWVAEVAAFPTLMTLLLLPFIDQLMCTCFAPIDEEVIASEFPMPCYLYNDLVSFPNGFAMTRDEDASWIPRFLRRSSQ